MTDEMVRARVRASGRVQGVFYRQSTVQEAADAGVSGWVRNADDGSVEAAIEGTRAAVERVLDFMREGPSAARVDVLDVEWEKPVGETGFSVRW